MWHQQVGNEVAKLSIWMVTRKNLYLCNFYLFHVYQASTIHLSQVYPVFDQLISPAPQQVSENEITVCN